MIEIRTILEAEPGPGGVGQSAGSAPSLWYLGDEEFRAELLAQVQEKMG